ncbi:pseudaminic acid biosynthesis-associated methylase [Roseospirillum parvum]|uniref:Spore coat polysaccharide biosynthesis protein SpsF n=1 Tax=Roseospirillum parvum TaxID=83401 RepID=A0A1G7YCZ5_9PROT|nr:pseudaminic acid biosynthesis-associated methylase [Roseospirillum parvum]SDG94264.1 spore coat polysaccharide biosynthesis protein SpsF [Roseospirillum parvum]
MTRYKTEQEAFWAGEFGVAYTERSTKFRSANVAFWSRILELTGVPGSVLELGANVGQNLRAINVLSPESRMTGVEIQAGAAAELGRVPNVRAINQSALEWEPDGLYDLVITKGFLIHVDPSALPGVYDTLHQAAGRYVVIAEYYNPTPVEVTYRGHREKLFKRDFAGEFLDRFDDMELVDYGFVWKRDPAFPQDDLTWFVLRRHD